MSNNPTSEEFIDAVYQKKYEDVENILKIDNSIINIKNNDEKTAILMACSEKNIDIKMIKLLINFGANVNLPTKEGYTCLTAACEKRHVDLVKLLLENNCTLNITTEPEHIRYSNYLYALARTNNCEILKLIMDHPNAKHINLNVQDDRGYTPLMVAVDFRNMDITKLLIKYGADVNVTAIDHSWSTSVLHLSVCRDIKLFEYLFDLVDFSSVVEKLASLDKQNNLLKDMFWRPTLWYTPEGVDILINVLNHSRIKPLLKKFNHVYYSFFNESKSSDITVNDFKRVLHKLLELGIPFKMEHFFQFSCCIQRMKWDNYEYSLLIDSFVRKGHLNLDQKDIFINILEHNSKLIFDVLKYCIKYNYSYIIKLIVDNSFCCYNIKYCNVIKLLTYCSPQSEQINKLYNLNGFYDEDDHNENNKEQYKNVMKDFHRFPSLLELARDATRNYIQNFVQNSKDYIEFMDKLPINKCFYDILTVRTPIYFDV